MTRTANELAQFLGCPIEGDGSMLVSGVAAPASARASDLIYVETLGHLNRAAASAARCVVISPGLEIPAKTLLRATNPKLAFARVAEWLLPRAPIATGIHPTAVISPTALLAQSAAVGPYVVIEDGVEIGAGTEIGAFCFLGRGVTIGEGCRLYPRVTLYAGARAGNRVILHSGAVIGSDGFGYVAEGGKRYKFPQVGEIEIHDDVEIGANTTVDSGRFGKTHIGEGVKIDNLVQIAHNVTIGAHSIVVSQTGISGSTSLGRYVTLAGQVGLAGHLTVGDRATVTAQSGLNKDVPAGAVLSGHHAMPIRESLKVEALTRRLPELVERLKALEEKVRLLP